MKLKYFNINHSLDDLKKKRKQYALRFHPDLYKSEGEKATASKKMAEINAEYDFVVDPQNRVATISPSAGGPIFNPGPRPKYSDEKVYTEKEKRQAQNLFHALTNGSGFDAELFVHTANAVKNWISVIEIYSKNYGDLFEQIKKSLKTEKHQKYAIDFIKTAAKDQANENFANNMNSIFNFFSKIFKP